MQALIMAGGFGSRLKPLTNQIPKPMVNIIDKPILEYIIQHLKSYGIVDIILTLGYLPKKIMDYFGDGSKFGVKIKYCIEKTPLGTAGGVKLAEKYIKEDFLIFSGDAFCNIDISSLVNQFYSNNKLLTMAIKQVKNAMGFGLVKVENSQLVSFEEKPAYPISGKVNMGIYAVDKNLLKLIPNGKYDFSKDLFPRILNQIGLYETNCFWSDIGTLSSYYLTNNYVALHPKSFGLSF